MNTRTHSCRTKKKTEWILIGNFPVSPFLSINQQIRLVFRLKWCSRRQGAVDFSRNCFNMISRLSHSMTSLIFALHTKSNAQSESGFIWKLHIIARSQPLFVCFVCVFLFLFFIWSRYCSHSCSSTHRSSFFSPSHIPRKCIELNRSSDCYYRRRQSSSSSFYLLEIASM